MHYITNKNYNLILNFNSNLKSAKNGAFYSIYYNDITNLGTYSTQKKANKDLQKVYSNIKNRIPISHLRGNITFDLPCNICQYYNDEKCKFRFISLKRKCPYINI